MMSPTRLAPRVELSSDNWLYGPPIRTGAAEPTVAEVSVKAKGRTLCG